MKIKLGSIKNHVFQTRDFLFDLFFPISCLNCSQGELYLCPECSSMLNFRTSYHCLKCKKANLEDCLCTNCLVDYHIDNILIAGDYENKLLAKLIKNLKYRFILGSAEILGNYLSNYLLTSSQLNFSEAIIMPVPLHKKRLRWRGFNQSGEIAKVISENLNLKMDQQNLIRVQHKKAQAKLGEAQRRKNVKNCFEWIGDKLENKNIILVDDVTTTGSTLDECARILKEGGAKNVWGLVVANG